MVSVFECTSKTFINPLSTSASATNFTRYFFFSKMLFLESCTPLWTATLSHEKNSSKKNCLFQHILKCTLHSIFHATSCTSKELIFRDVHFHNSGKPYQFTEKHLHFQQEFSIWNIISYFSNIFGNWESVIIDEKSLGKFTGEIFNVHYYFAPKPN